MKKIASLAVAGALLLASTGVAFAHMPSFISQFSFTSSDTEAISSSGSNYQTGFGVASQTIKTGGSEAEAHSLTAGNVSFGGGNVMQGSYAESLTGSGSDTGSNGQLGGSFWGTTTQSITTGGSSATAGSFTISNLNFSFH